MKAINRVLGKVDAALGKVEDAICCTLLVVMSCIIFIQIVCRVLNYPLVWSEEISRFMFIWLIYICVCVSAKRESHLCCDILPIVVKSPTGKLVIKIVSNLLCLCFFIFITYHGIGVLEKLIARPQKSAAIQMNMVWAYLGPYLGSAIASVHYIVLILREIEEIIDLRKNKGGLEA